MAEKLRSDKLTSFGRRVVNILDDLGKTPAELADRLPKHRSSFYRALQNPEISTSILVAICNELHIDPNALLEWENPASKLDLPLTSAFQEINRFSEDNKKVTLSIIKTVTTLRKEQLAAQKS